MPPRPIAACASTARLYSLIAMTALAGIWNHDGRPGPETRCERMLTAQRIYGPHGTAVRSDGDIALGRALFEILPEDIHDRGPIVGGGTRYLLVADVRLDDRDDLARRLGIASDAACRLPDAAMLMKAWERWQEGAFAHLYGDYAFALWDGGARRLILARDHAGTKPLHYHIGQGFIAFASMPKGLHALPEIPLSPDAARAAEFLALLPENGPRSFFEGISRVEPGHWVAITAEGMKAHRHWNPRSNAPSPGPAGDAAEALREHFDRAVATRLRRSDGAVGTHLSAGMDSAAVTATAARLAPAGERLIAFTAVPREGYDGPAPPGRIGDVGPLAAATAALYPNVEHLLVRPGPASLLDGLDRDFFLNDRPLLNLCNQRWVADINAAAQRRDVRVLLTGQMGNATISYAGTELLPELVTRGRLLRLLREILALGRTGNMRWRGALLTAFGPWMPLPLWSLVHRLAGQPLYTLGAYSAVNPAHEAELAELARERALDFNYRPRRSASEMRLWVMGRMDFANFHKASVGGWGIDQRDPTADRRLIEFLFTLPTTAFLDRGVQRALGKRAFSDRLPAAVLDERRRGYQAVDWHEGLAPVRDQARDEIARLANVPAAEGALDLDRMAQLIDRWPEGSWHRPEIEREYRQALLRGIATGHFLRKASRSNA